MCTKFQACIVFGLAKGVAQINTYTNIQVKLGISSAGCSPHLDFDSYFSNGETIQYCN